MPEQEPWYSQRAIRVVRDCHDGASVGASSLRRRLRAAMFRSSGNSRIECSSVGRIKSPPCRTMAVSSVLTFGQWGYPNQGLGSYGGAEEKNFRKRRISALARATESRPGSESSSDGTVIRMAVCDQASALPVTLALWQPLSD